MLSEGCLKRGVRRPVWVADFKIALATENLQKIQQLAFDMPAFENVEAMQEASYLLSAAEALFQAKKNETAREMQRLRKNIDFLNASASSHKNKLDLTF